MADVLAVKTQEQISDPSVDLPEFISISVYDAKKWFRELLDTRAPGTNLQR